MTHCYLFECKSVQAYIFGSTRLIDIISASERLDRLIDSEEQSFLFKVCEQLGLESDLTDPRAKVSANGIEFLRCKGGAIQAMSQSRETLQKFRSVWQLTVQQLFPSLSFVDALASGNDLSSALTKAYEELGKAQNLPRSNWPMATAIVQRYPRTGRASVPQSSSATKVKDETWKSVDADVNKHRAAYTTWNVKEKSRLQERFIDASVSDIRFPTDHDSEFDTGAVKDIALLHADGNGLGQLLMSLRSVLKSKDNHSTKMVLRDFSELINTATVKAAKKATAKLYKQHTAQGSNGYLPMRPIVLGGDDLTVLVGASYALRYMEHFTEAFQDETAQAISELIKNHGLSAAGLPANLTASGGIVFCKLGHPFVATSELVEQATASAKSLSKLSVAEGNIAPASVAFCRTSTVVTSDYDEYLARTSCFAQVKNSHQVKEISLAQGGYLLNGEGVKLEDLRALAKFCRTAQSPVSIAKWRQMETHLSVGDFNEAQRIFERACKLKPEGVGKLKYLTETVLATVAGEFKDWFVVTDSGKAYSFIHDLLVLDHFDYAKGTEAARENG